MKTQKNKLASIYWLSENVLGITLKKIKLKKVHQKIKQIVSKENYLKIIAAAEGNPRDILAL